MRTQKHLTYQCKSTLKKQYGVSLIEALISLLIVSFGMMGLMGMHLKLQANSDVSKQRSEAVRLAQADMENLRVLRTIGVASTDPLLWTNRIVNVSNSAVTTGTTLNSYTSNTSYSLTRSVNTSAVADMKDVQVAVSWNDRTGSNQSVVLRTFVAGIDPSVAVSLSIAPNGSPVRDTLGRDIQVPIPAHNLGTKSIFKPRSDATTAYVFDNDTGIIDKVCTGIASTTQNAGISAVPSSGCVDVTAYLLSGFIRFSTGNINNNFDPTTANDLPPSGTSWATSLIMNDVAPATGTHGKLSLLASTNTAWSSNVSSSRYPTVPYTCSSELLKTISFTAAVSYITTNNGATTTTTSSKVFLTVPHSLALTAAAVSPFTSYATSAISSIIDEQEYYVGYSCIVYPIDLDGSTSTSLPLTPLAWTGRPYLTAVGASIGTGANAYKVCRFSQDYNLNGYVWQPISPLPSAASNENVTKIDNEEHPYAYLNVSKSLSNQNYLVIAGNKSCPSDSEVEVNGTGSENYTNATTVTHQP